MPAPSGHRLYQAPTFTNCRLPKTMLLESSQAVLQIPIHNTFTRKPRRCLFPITSNFMHLNSNKSQLPTHPLHNLTKQAVCTRRMKQTIFENWSGKTIDINNNNTIPSTPDSISQNLKSIHTLAVSECLQSYKPNPILAQPAPNINVSEQSFPRKTRHILTQLRVGKSPVLTADLHTIDPKFYPSPICPLSKSHDHTTQHLFSCSTINTTLSILDLWDDAVAVVSEVGGRHGSSRRRSGAGLI